MACFDMGISLDPRNAFAHAAKGKSLQALGRHQEAVACLDVAIGLKPNRAFPHRIKGKSLQALGNHRESMACLDESIRLDPRNAPAHAAKGKSLQALGRHQEAVACLDVAVGLSPDYSFAHATRGISLQALGRHQEAVACLDETLRLDPKNAFAYGAKGRSLQELGRYEESLACLDRAIDLGPNYPFAYVTKGVSLQEIGRHREAIACLDEAIRLDPKNAFAYGAKGRSLQELGRYEESLACLDRAIDLGPNYPFAYVTKGVSLQEIGRHREAIACLDEAIRLDPKNAFAHRRKGVSLQGLGESREAIACLDEAMALDPSCAFVHEVDEGGFSGLDPRTRHCLVDTMVLLQMRQGDPDVIGDAKRELRGAALVLLDIIAVEAAHRHGKQDGGHGMADPKYFVSFLSGLLKSRDIRFKLVRVEQGMYASVLQMLYDRAHPRLSEADCTLLSAAVGCPDMDVMTSDKALADAINSERGPKAKGRVLDAMSSHHGRRQSTAKLIRNRLGSYIPKGARVEWYDRFHRTVFLIAGATVSIDHVEKGRVRVDLRPLVAKPDKKILKIQSELGVEVRERFFRPEIQWVQERLRKETSAGKGPAHAELGYGDHAEGLDGETKRRLERKLRGKGIGGRDP